jgi:mono/diheme cytochrome c family protein
MGAHMNERLNGPTMVGPNSMSSIISERWKLWSVMACLMGATGVLVTASLDAASAQERAVPKQDIILGSDARNGKSLFEEHCVLCHGPRGKGDGFGIAGSNVADLSSPETQRKLNVDLLKTVHDGRPGKVMPSWKSQLSDKQVHDVLAYVRTLRK